MGPAGSEDGRSGEQLIDVLGPGEGERYDDLSAKLGLDEGRLIDRWAIDADGEGGRRTLTTDDCCLQRLDDDAIEAGRLARLLDCPVVMSRLDNFRFGPSTGAEVHPPHRFRQTVDG
jgi:hypothetical protein